MTSDPTRSCPECGGRIVPDATGGLCPKCLFALALDQSSDSLIGQTLSHFQVLERLSIGGMGVVYRARDTRLDRLVAIKFVRDEFLNDREALSRFKKEARAVATLHHPHIGAFLDFGEHAGRLFLVTELIEGETLQARIARGPLPFREIFRIAVQIGEALQTAHAKGFIHRDIKPANILLTAEGDAKILDFGLAKLFEGDSPGPRDETAGTFAGTIPYMSPEQLQNRPVDARSDLFSLGAVLYEMAAGQAPFAAGSPAETIAAIQGRDPAPLSQCSRGIPRAFARLVEKLLAKDPARRHSGAAEVVEDLRRISPRPSAAPSSKWWRVPTSASIAATALAALAALLLLLAPVFLWRSAEVNPSVESIAVLPFRNLSANPDQGAISDGMTDALIGRLAQIDGLRVLPRTMTESYREQRVPLRAMMASLEVDALIEGSVLPADNSVLVVITLSDTRQVLFTREYQRDTGDMLQVITEIAQSVAEGIRANLTPQEEARLTASRGEDEQALLDYWAGRYVLNTRTPEAFEKAIDYFRKAIERSPEFAEAHAGLAQAYIIWGATGYAPGWVDIAEGKRAAERALALNPDLAEAHTALAAFLMGYDRDWTSAETHFHHALALNPDYAEARHWHALYRAAQGDLDAALGELMEAMRLDPQSPVIRAALGRIFYYRRDYAEAERYYHEALDLEPNSVPSRLGLFILYLEQGNFATAFREIEKGFPTLTVPALTDEGLFYLAAAIADANQGRYTEAGLQLSRLVEAADAPLFPAMHLAILYAVMEQVDPTLHWLQESINEQSDYLNFIEVDPLFDHVRQDPRYQRILEEIGLAR